MTENKEKRRRKTLRLLLPHRGGDPRASLVAFAVQVAIIAIIVPSLIVPIAFDLLRDDSGRVATPERISFVVAVPNRERTLEAPVAGGDGREPGGVETTVISEPIIAPTEVPTGVPTAPAEPDEDPLGVGPLVGGGGPTRGVRPSFTDARLWAPTADEVMAPNAPRTRADTLRQMLAERANVYLDSMARVAPSGDPTDWTFERNGRKYGIDSKFIRLGKFSIPTALLAALPLNIQGQANPIASERIRRLNSMSSEIQYQSARMAREDEFRDAVRELRERKERERKEEAARKAGERRPDSSDSR